MVEDLQSGEKEESNWTASYCAEAVISSLEHYSFYCFLRSNALLAPLQDPFLSIGPKGSSQCTAEEEMKRTCP